MKQFEHSVEATATRKTIHEIYVDLDARPIWDESVERITLEGPFAAGASGVMAIKEQGPIPFRLIEVRTDGGFTDETVLPDAGVTLRFAHELTSLGDARTRITHRLTVSGAAPDEVQAEIGQLVTSDFPEAMAALVRLAEEREDGR